MNLEIEKKYTSLHSSVIFEAIKQILHKVAFRYEIKQVSVIDSYYDTNDYLLMNNKETLRIRKINDVITLDIKIPHNYKSNTLERFESITKINKLEWEDILTLAYEYLPKLKNKYILPKLNIINERNLWHVFDEQDNLKLEIAKDYVAYRKDNIFATEHQLEIEAKNKLGEDDLDICDKVIKKNFYDQILPTTNSKYERGLYLLGLTKELKL